MNVLVLWGVWGTFVLITLILYVIRGRVTNDEVDQVILDESFSHEQAAQAAITAKVNKIQPILKLSQMLVLAATVVVVGYYIWDVINQFK